MPIFRYHRPETQKMETMEAVVDIWVQVYEIIQEIPQVCNTSVEVNTLVRLKMLRKAKQRSLNSINDDNLSSEVFGIDVTAEL